MPVRPALTVASFLLCLALPGPAIARAPGPIESVYVPLATFADTLARRAKPPAAHAYVDSVARAAAARGDRATRAAALLYRAQRYATFEEEFEKGAPYFAEALPMIRALRDTFALAEFYYDRGYGQQLRGRLVEAEADLTLAVRFARRARHARIEGEAHRSLGNIAKVDGRYPVARRELEAALRHLPESSFGHLHTRLMVGEVLNRTGHADEARDQFEAVLAEARKRKNRWTIAAAMHDLANVAFEQGDMAEADRQWAQASAHYDTLTMRGIVNASSAIQARVNRAHALIVLGRLDEARRLLDAQVERCKEVPDPSLQTSVRAEIGVLERRAGRPEAAERMFRSVLAADTGRDAMDEEAASIELVGLLRETGRLDDAERQLDTLLVPDRLARMTDVNVAATYSEKSALLRARGRPAEALVAARFAERRTRALRTKPSIYWLDAAVELARCQRAVGRPDSAVVTLAGAARAWERWRAQISNFEWRERAASGLSGLFTEYGLALLDARRGGTEARRARDAFDALQVFQARTLEERMQGQGLSARAMARRVSADSLRLHVLRPGEALLDLVATPETTFAFVVTRTGTTAHLLAGTDRLGALFGDWRGAMLGGAAAPIVERGLERLSAELLGSLAAPLRGTRSLIVSGGGPVMLWPIGALTLPGEPAALGESRDVVAVPSATMFALLRARSLAVRGPGAGRLLALSRTTDAAGRDLPGAEREIARLGRAYAGVTTRQNKGTQTVAALTADLGRFDALHFAAHAEATAGTPWRSGFLLGRGAGEDAYFRASSVARMRLSARLAVLSGCQSAGATALAGEGALGLTSGFLCAGTRTVVATLWPVEDRTAERFMNAFYASLAAGRTAAGAAREARAALRAGAGTGNPRDWAAFVVVGEPGTTFPLKARGRT